MRRWSWWGVNCSFPTLRATTVVAGSEIQTDPESVTLVVTWLLVNVRSMMVGLLVLPEKWVKAPAVLRDVSPWCYVYSTRALACFLLVLISS